MILPENISSRITEDKDNGCWNWKCAGQRVLPIGMGGKFFPVRRFLWQLSGKELSEDRELRATCKNPKCVRPEHMRISSGTLEQRLFCNFHIAENGCWIWDGSKDRHGYGIMTWGGRNLRPYKVSYEMFVAKIPKGLIACHHCDTPSCFNPAHIFAGTHKDNSEDMVKKGRSFGGEEHHSSKLTPAKVIQLRTRFEAGEKLRRLAREFEISRTSAKKVVEHQTWKHVS